MSKNKPISDLLKNQLKIEQWPIDRLIEYARNPRKNDAVVDKMVASIKEFGFRIPIVAKSDGSVVDGHLRLKAARKLGMAEVPVALADELTDAQVKAFRLLANRSVDWAEWDNDLLKLELDELKEMDFDLELTGFEIDEISEITGLDAGAGGLTDPDDVPEVQENEPPVSKEGDIWILGNHRLMCGDSTDAGNVALLMAGQKADMVFTDPPYNVSGESRNFAADAPDQKIYKKLKDTDWDKNFDIKIALGRIAESVSKDVTIYICTSHFLAPQIWNWMKDNFDFYSFCIWNKPNPMPCLSKRHWTWNTEIICYATKGKHIFNFPKEGYALSTWTIPKIQGKSGHPTEKPVAIPEMAITHSSQENSIIFDLFGGSGTTLIACEQTNRQCRMMELDPHYCDVIVKRWQDFTGQKAVHEGSGKNFDDMKSEILNA